MRRFSRPLSVLPLSLILASFASAAEVVYVTDLTIFTALAPCVQSALYYNIQWQTGSNCPEDVNGLQACVCTKNNNLVSISDGISSSVSYSCGATATDDQASAATVLSAYCDQDNIPEFPTPANPVTAYITDIPEVENGLPPCAYNALSYAIQSMQYDRCPSDAPQLATCVCDKNQNRLVVSQLINTSVKYSCSSHTADISSAQAMFSAYCNMNNGTSSFPKPGKPSGDMTYYITDLPQISSLAPCAQSAVSYAVLKQTYDLCPPGPQALASCACLKDQMVAEITGSITSNVKYSCDSTATDDISSAISLFGYFCSAVQGKVRPNGVTASFSQSSLDFPTAQSGSRSGPGGPEPTGGSGSEDGSGGSGSAGSSDVGSGNGGGGTDGSNKDNSSGPGTGVIVGAAVGGLVALIAIGILIFFLVKQAQKRKELQTASDPTGPPPGGSVMMSNPAAAFVNGGDGKPELAANSVAVPPPPPSPSPSTAKVPARSNNVSPVSAHANTFTTPTPPPPPMPNGAELPGQQTAPHPPMPNSAELHGQAPAYPPVPNSNELYGGMVQGQPPHSPIASPGAPAGAFSAHQQQYQPYRPELQGQGAPYQIPNRPELMGQQQQQRMYGGYYQPQYPQQHQQGYPQPHPAAHQVSPVEVHGQQRPAELQPTAWQSGPVPGQYLHEMDGGHQQQQQQQGFGQAR